MQGTALDNPVQYTDVACLEAKGVDFCRECGEFLGSEICSFIGKDMMERGEDLRAIRACPLG